MGGLCRPVVKTQKGQLRMRMQRLQWLRAEKMSGPPEPVCASAPETVCASAPETADNEISGMPPGNKP